MGRRTYSYPVSYGASWAVRRWQAWIISMKLTGKGKRSVPATILGYSGGDSCIVHTVKAPLRRLDGEIVCGLLQCCCLGNYPGEFFSALGAAPNDLQLWKLL